MKHENIPHDAWTPYVYIFLLIYIFSMFIYIYLFHALRNNCYVEFVSQSIKNKLEAS